MKFRVDLAAVVFRMNAGELNILAIRRSSGWRLPSITLPSLRDPEEILSRTIEELGVKANSIEQLYTFLDPKAGSLVMSYIVLACPEDSGGATTADNGLDWTAPAARHRLTGIQGVIRDAAVQRLRNKVAYSRIATRLLGEEFTLGELMNVYEQIRGEPLDKRNFRKMIEAKKLAEPTGTYRYGTHRPARLYRPGPKAKNVSL